MPILKSLPVHALPYSFQSAASWRFYAIKYIINGRPSAAKSCYTKAQWAQQAELLRSTPTR